MDNVVSIKVKAWSNGSGYYGIRVDRDDRCLFEVLQKFELQIGGEESFTVSLSPSFWRSCTHFDDRKIGEWLIKN